MEDHAAIWRLRKLTRMFLSTLDVRAYVISTLLLYEAILSRNSFVISTGLVEPALFFRPRRLALISPPLTFISDWWGNVISCRPRLSLEQNTIILREGSLLNLLSTGWSDTLIGIVAEWRWFAIARIRVSPLLKQRHYLHAPSNVFVSPICWMVW